MSEAKIIISLIQTMFFVIFGPLTLLFGGSAVTFVIFVQAALTSGWFELMASWKSINADNVFTALNMLVAWVIATMALGISSAVSAKLRNMMKGMVLFVLITETPMKAMSAAIFRGIAGCTEIGDPTLDFPQGLPSGGCFPTDEKFRHALYVQKSISFVFLISGAITGCFCESLVGKWSVAMSGAAMTVQAFTELISAIATEAGNPEDATDIAQAIGGVECGLIYGLAIAGFMYQMLTNSFVSAYKPGAENEQLTGIRKWLLCKPMLIILKYLMAFDGCLAKLVEKVLNADLFNKASSAAEAGADVAHRTISGKKLDKEDAEDVENENVSKKVEDDVGDDVDKPVYHV